MGASESPSALRRFARKHRRSLLLGAAALAIPLALVLNHAISEVLNPPHYEVRVPGSTCQYKFFYDIPVGKYACSNETMTSRGFMGCSALVVDFGEKALFFHALSSATPKSARKGRVNCENVLPLLMGELRKRRVEPWDCAVSLYSGSKSDYNNLTTAVRGLGFRIEWSQLNEDVFLSETIYDDVSYDPASNRSTVTRCKTDPPH